jgi:hypothetical protein
MVAEACPAGAFVGPHEAAYGALKSLPAIVAAQSAQFGVRWDVRTGPYKADAITTWRLDGHAA